MNSQLWAPSRLAFTYYGLWDADELYDLEADPNEMHNLRFAPAYRETVAAMETRLYDMMDELGGCAIPLNRPQGNSSNIRLRSRGGAEGDDFPAPLVVDQPPNRNAR